MNLGGVVYIPPELSLVGPAYWLGIQSTGAMIILKQTPSIVKFIIMCIPCTHKNDHVRTLKILQSMSESGGLRKYEKIRHALYD